MRKAALLISILWLTALLASCGQDPEPTTTPSSTPSPALTPPTPTSTPLPPSPSPTATPHPTSTPTPTPTPADAGWNRYPNALDFRSIQPHDGDLWLGALSGLIHLDVDRSRWTAFTESDGLVNNSVSSLVIQDSLLWIGTLGGISRYDLAKGTWRSYTTDAGLSGNQILRIYSDGNTIWAGTPNGLSWYKPADDTWDSLFAVADTELAGVEDIAGDQDTLWITVSPYADDRGGLFMLDRETGEWTPISQTTSTPPIESYQLVSGPATLWAIPSAGLPWEHNKQTSTWRPLSELDPDGLETGDAYVGGQFHAGALWLYAEHTGSLVRYEPRSHSVSSYPAAPLVALGTQASMAGYENTLWFGGDVGLLAFRLDTGEWKAERRVVGALYHIHGERDGDLLVSSDLGPGFWNPADLQWRPLAPVGGTGLFATQGAAMEQGIPGVWLIERLTVEPDTDGPPQLAYFTEPGVEPQRFDLAPPAGWELESLLPNAVGDTVWFLGTRGFLSYNPAVDQWGVFEIAQEPLQVHHTRQQNSIVWYVTDTDLGRFDTSSAELSLVSLPITPTLAREPALAVSEQELWLLLDNSIYHLASEGDWLPVSTAAPCLDGADNLAFWNGALWLGGKQGVGSLAWPPSEEAPAWRCYGPANGMLDAEFEQIVPTKDELWFLHSQRGLWSFSGN